VILRTLLLAGGGLLLLFGSEAVGFAGAGPLGCVVTAFMANWGWQADGWTDKTVSSCACSAVCATLHVALASEFQDRYLC
jgi:hypothetical protein